ncbi:MAG: cytochrome c biogenesis protein ResB, partial [Planctomycetaceae bacterium]
MASIPQGSALNTAADAKPLSDQIRAMVKPLASLKITVTVFSLSMFLILIGSLAQARTDVWEVVGQYFRCWVAWIDIKDFFPPAFFPSLIEYNWDELWINKACVKMFNRPQIPFFGGWTLGLVATINLLAAHGLRFKVQVKGQRLLAGTATLAVGLVVTWFVVAGGMNADGFQSQPKLSYQTVWQIFQVSVVICCLGLGWQLWKHRSWITGGIGLLLVATMYFACVSKPLSEPSMRILWQLMKAEFASVILLAACWLLFKKRSGVVLLHAGVAVLMLSEVLVGLTVSENRFQMWEGDSANYVFDLRERELVVVDNSGDEAKVVSIPETMILNAAASEDDARVIDDERLPFKIQLVDFYRHSTLKNAKPDDENPANAGTGLKVVATELPKAGGMDSRSDESTAYVRLLSRKDDSDLGTFMLAMRLEGSYEPVLVDGKIYDMALRFKRTYKDYSVTLLDVEKRDYIGTTTPRDYSSYIRLVDEGNNVDREIRVWMNNPLRYRGETLYQTDYFLDTKTGRELSSLQVVNNRGWMLPYMACMIVLTGMAVQ